MNRFYLLFLALFTQISISSRATETNAFTAKVQFGFVENMGQIKTQDGSVNKDVLYLFRTGNMQVQLRKNGFSYELFQESKPNELPHLALERNSFPEATSVKIHRVDIDFKGAILPIRIVEKEQGNSELILHEEEDANSTLNIHHFRRIVYKNVYPKVDIEFLIADENGSQKFKYNVILHPGADASMVRLEVFGSNQTQISKKGNLTFTTSIGNMEEQIPYSYELKENEEIGESFDAKFVKLKESTFGFDLKERISSKTRVIDPILWCTYFGGEKIDISVSVKGDTSGNVYIGGYTSSTANIATAGAYQTSFNGTGYDVFLAKFSNDGILIWATYFGGTSNENLTGMTVTRNGSIALVGQTQSDNGIATSGAFQNTFGGNADGFVTLFGSTGNLIWSSYFGGITSDYFSAVSEDVSGDLLILGSSNSTTVFNYPGVHQSTIGGNTDAILLKVSSLGALKWATYYGGTLSENGYGICTDLANNIYIVGTTESTGSIVVGNAFQMVLSGTQDAFVAKFSTNGQQIFGTYFGGANIDFPRDININLDGNICFAGYTYSTTGFPLKNAYKSNFTSVTNHGFVSMMDTAGNLLWSTLFGGELQNILIGSSIDKLGNVYFTGYTTSKTEIATTGAFQDTIKLNYDAFFGSFDKAGNLNWSTYFGGSKFEYAWKPYVDKNQNLFVFGYTNSDSLSFGTTIHQRAMDGTFETFLLKMALDTNSGALANNTIGNNQTLCGTSIANDLIGSSPSGGSGSYTYTWLQSSTGLSGSFVIASGTNTNKDYSPGSIVAETYYKRVVTDGSAFDTSNVVTIKLGSAFHAGFTVNKAIQCLRSNEFIFTDTTTAPGLTYDWDFGNGATSTNQSETISYAYQAANVYKVRLITSFGGSCADTNYKMVYTVSDPIAKNITGIDQVRRLDTASYSIPHTAGSRYVWVFDNGQLKGNGTGNQIQIKWTAVGTTQLKVVETSSGNCLGDTAFLDITISPALEVEELTNENAFQVYPNPNTGSFVIGGLNQKEFTVNVYDARGALVKTQEIQGETRIELENASAGLYVIQLIHSNGNVYQKKMQIDVE
jgi:hypothetical protein